MNELNITLTLAEARALSHAAEMGTLDDAIDNIGFGEDEKVAFRSAESKLTRAIMTAIGFDSSDYQ